MTKPFISKTVSNPDADLLAPIIGCMASWGKNSCPNEVVAVIVNRKAPGYCAVCEPHASGFSGGDKIYKLMSLAEFEQARRDGLYSLYAVPQ